MLGKIRKEDFNILQHDTLSTDPFEKISCEDLCDLPGWKTLVQKNPFLFSHFKFQEFIDFNIDKYFTKNSHFKILPQYEEQFQYQKKFINSLKLFEKAQFKESLDILNSISKNNLDRNETSHIDYWIGRDLFALNQKDSALLSFLKSGKENPMGLYDSFSGQFLNKMSLKTSTDDLSSMNHWKKYYNTWFFLDENKIASESELTSELFEEFNLLNQLSLAMTLNASYKTVSGLQNICFLENHFSCQFFKRILLEEEFKLEYYLNSSSNFKVTSNSIKKLNLNKVWLNFAVGNYFKSLQNVFDLEGEIDFDDPQSKFIYFVFYPKPFEPIIHQIENKCYVDSDIVYSYLRQKYFYYISYNETLPNIKSNIQHFMCTYSKTKQKNIIPTMFSFLEGEENKEDHSTDRDDEVLYLDMVKDEKIKQNLKNIIRDYYNMKWIYDAKKTTLSIARSQISFSK